MIRLGHVLTERCAKSLAAAILALRSGTPAARLLAKDTGALLDQLRQAGFADLLFGLDKALRHADAHAAFEIRDERVVFTSSSREYDSLTWDQLFDRVIGGFESVLGINLGLVVAAARLGVVLDMLHALGLTVEEKSRIVFSLGGLQTHAVSVDGKVLRAELVGQEEPPLAFIGMLTPHMPDEIDAVALTVRVKAISQDWQADLDALRRWSIQDDPAIKHALFCGAVAAIRRNGVPAYSSNLVRRLAATAVGQEIGKSDPSAATKSARVRAPRHRDQSFHRIVITCSTPS